MRQLPMPFTIKAGETVEFVPQGKHLMIMGLNKPLKLGESFELSLTFVSGETQTISIPVQDNPGAQQTNSHHHHH